MTQRGWGYDNSWKGRCTKCRWSFFRGERYCTSCGGWVRYPTQYSGEDQGAQPTQGKVPPTLPLPSKQQQNAAALKHQPQQGHGRTAWATPKGTPKAGTGRSAAQIQPGAMATNTQPGDLEKIYRFSATVLGEQHPETVRAKEAWKTAEKDVLRKNPPTLEKQIHTAKENIGRM